MVQYLLEQGADRDKANTDGWTALHDAVVNGHLEVTKLLMIYGANLNARNDAGDLPIDLTANDEIRQAIRDEPRRRMDAAPGKRATEQDRHSNASASAAAHQDYEQEEEQRNKRQRLEKGADAEGKVAEEDEDSEPSDGEDD